MLVDKENPIAETVLLQWDKTSPAELVFYASRTDTEWHFGCVGSFKLLYSTDSISWSELWGEELLEWTPTGYEPVRVTLPLAEADTKFALKWTYTQEKSSHFSCYEVRLDDMTFPAQTPAKPAKPAKPVRTNAKPTKPVKQPQMPAGVAPIPMPLSFQGICTWAATYCGMAVADANNATNTTAKVNGTTAVGNATNNNTAAPVVKTAPPSPAPKPAPPSPAPKPASTQPTAGANTAVNADTVVDAEPAADDAEETAPVVKGAAVTAEEEPSASDTESTAEETADEADPAQEETSGLDTDEPASQSASGELAAGSEEEVTPNAPVTNAVPPDAAAANSPGRKLKLLV
jgi:hypothetical protein